jgi:hypothetical protein
VFLSTITSGFTPRSTQSLPSLSRFVLPLIADLLPREATRSPRSCTMASAPGEKRSPSLVHPEYDVMEEWPGWIDELAGEIDHQRLAVAKQRRIPKVACAAH